MKSEDSGISNIWSPLLVTVVVKYIYIYPMHISLLIPVKNPANQTSISNNILFP